MQGPDVDVKTKQQLGIYKVKCVILNCSVGARVNIPSLRISHKNITVLPALLGTSCIWFHKTHEDCHRKSHRELSKHIYQQELNKMVSGSGERPKLVGLQNESKSYKKKLNPLTGTKKKLY